MNKKIASEIAIGIILIVVVIIGGVFWMQNKKESKLKIDQNATSFNVDNKSLKTEKKTEVAKRFSGSNCYAKNADGSDDLYVLSKDFNLADPTETVPYRNSAIGVFFEVPYNPDWGNKNCKVEPYIEHEFASGNSDLEFGAPRAWITSAFHFSNRDARSAEDIIKEQRNIVGGKPSPNPRKMMIGKKQIVAYESYGMGIKRIYEVVGTKYNYSFSYTEADKLNENTTKLLERIIVSMSVAEDSKELSEKDQLISCIAEKYKSIVNYEKLQRVGTCFAKDDKNVYMASWCGQACDFDVILSEADLKSFEKVTGSGFYARDKNNVYFSKIGKINGADPKTFNVIMNDHSLSGYSSDKNNVYYFGHIIRVADPKTFQFSNKDKTGLYQDKNNSYSCNAGPFCGTACKIINLKTNAMSNIVWSKGDENSKDMCN